MCAATRGSGCRTAATSEAGAWASAGEAHASPATIAARIVLPLTAASFGRGTPLRAFSTRDEPLVRLVEGEPALPLRVEGDLQRRGERRMLDDDHREVFAAEDRVLHAEHHVALVDDDEL